MSVFTAPPPLRAVYLREDEGSLVVRPSAEQVKKFTRDVKPGTQVEVRQATRRVRITADATPKGIASDRPGIIEWARGEPMLYDRDGRPVARIVAMTHDVGAIDVTTFGDIADAYVRGLSTLRIEAIGVDGVTVL